MYILINMAGKKTKIKLKQSSSSKTKNIPNKAIPKVTTKKHSNFNNNLNLNVSAKLYRELISKILKFLDHNNLILLIYGKPKKLTKTTSITSSNTSNIINNKYIINSLLRHFFDNIQNIRAIFNINHESQYFKILDFSSINTIYNDNFIIKHSKKCIVTSMVHLNEVQMAIGLYNSKILIYHINSTSYYLQPISSNNDIVVIPVESLTKVNSNSNSNVLAALCSDNNKNNYYIDSYNYIKGNHIKRIYVNCAKNLNIRYQFLLDLNYKSYILYFNNEINQILNLDDSRAIEIFSHNSNQYEYCRKAKNHIFLYRNKFIVYSYSNFYYKIDYKRDILNNLDFNSNQEIINRKKHMLPDNKGYYFKGDKLIGDFLIIIYPEKITIMNLKTDNLYKEITIQINDFSNSMICDIIYHSNNNMYLIIQYLNLYYIKEESLNNVYSTISNTSMINLYNNEMILMTEIDYQTTIAGEMK